MKARTFNEIEVQLTNGKHEYSAREIGRSEERRTGVVIESSEARSEWDAGKIVLNEPVNVDDCDGIAQVDARDED